MITRCIPRPGPRGSPDAAVAPDRADAWRCWRPPGLSARGRRARMDGSSAALPENRPSAGWHGGPLDAAEPRSQAATGSEAVHGAVGAAAMTGVVSGMRPATGALSVGMK